MPPTNICDDIENDEFFKSFLLESRTSSGVATLTIADQIKKLSDGLEILSFELHSQVREQHGALLSQASHAGRLDSSLNTVIGHMERLQSGANRLKNHVGTQFGIVESQTKVLSRLHDASHILRSCGNMLHLTGKLRSTRDPAKQAAILFELEPLTEDTALNKIDFIREDRAFVLSSRQRLNNLAQMDLINGLRDGKEALVTGSIQIFVNLQTIDKCIDNLIETFLNEIAHSIKECFAGTDVATLNSSKLSQVDSSKDGRASSSSGPKGPGKTPSLTTSQHFRSKLWKSLNWLLADELYEYCQQIALLQKCLLNEFQNMNIFNEKEDVQTKFYKRLENLLRTSFSECAPHISQCLQEGLPNLLSATKSLQSKLPLHEIFSENLFESLEAGYLTKCGANLKASLMSLDCPTTENADNLIRAASTELSAAMVDNRLAMLVAGAFNACNKDFWTKIEANVKLGTDSKQVVVQPNAAQIQNANLANVVFYHSEGVKRLVSNLGDKFAQTSAAEYIIDNLDQGKNLILAILQQLIESMTTTVGIILLSMHREPGLNSDKLSISGPSLYMKELQDFLQRCWTSHMLPFSDEATVLECGEQLAARCIELFVNNLAILKPITSAGRNRLKNDCGHLENALKPIVGNLSSMGKPFRLLRAMSSLITLTPEQLVQQEIERDGLISCYIILSLLFTHGCSDLQSPHTAANWSNERLIQWLDGHTSDKERMELVAGALQRYRDFIRRKNSTQYDPVYPLLSNYFERGYKILIEKN